VTGRGSRFRSLFSDKGNLVNIYLYLVVGIPFVILGALGGWGKVFQSGGAAAFISGAIVAGIGELVIEQGRDGFSGVKAILPGSRSPDRDSEGQEIIGAFVVVAGLLIWNMYFAVADKYVQHPTVDWVQIVAFILAAVMLPGLRFAFSS